MKLQKLPFNNMSKGIKTIELRIFDEKRQQIKITDRIKFINLYDPEDTLLVKVIGLIQYPSFKELIYDVNPTTLGYTENDREYLIDSMRGIYTEEEEHKYGVLGIKVKII